MHSSKTMCVQSTEKKSIIHYEAQPAVALESLHL